MPCPTIGLLLISLQTSEDVHDANSTGFKRQTSGDGVPAPSLTSLPPLTGHLTNPDHRFLTYKMMTIVTAHHSVVLRFK